MRRGRFHLPLGGPRSLGSSAFLALSALAAALFLRPGSAEAQNQCDLIESNYFVQSATGTVNEAVYISRPVVACVDGTRIRADSAVLLRASNMAQFIGRVRFDEDDRSLTADRAHYDTRADRLDAWGQVVLREVGGSSVRGDTLLYERGRGPGLEDRLLVTGIRPHATVFPSPEPVEAPADSGRTARAVAPPSADPAAGRAPSAAGNPAPGRRPGGVAPLPVAVAGAFDPERGSPYEVDADEIEIRGGRGFRARGTVEITRDSLDAAADSVRFDEVGERLLLQGNARAEGERFVMAGQEVRLRLVDGEVEEVESERDASVSGEDVDITAEYVRIFVTEGRLERLVASINVPAVRTPEIEPEIATDTGAAPPLRSAAGDPGPRPVTGADRSAAAPPTATNVGAPGRRAHVVSQRFTFEGDSVDILAPAEVLERVVAVGAARGVSITQDSVRGAEAPEFARNDWLEGDTIVALFEPAGASSDSLAPGATPVLSPNPEGNPDDDAAAGPDARGNPELRRLRAHGAARSLYRLEPADSTVVAESARLAIHYVVGDTISIDMVDGEVDHMRVVGQTRGLYLEPLGRPPATVAGPAATPPGVPFRDPAVQRQEGS